MHLLTWHVTSRQTPTGWNNTCSNRAASGWLHRLCFSITYEDLYIQVIFWMFTKALRVSLSSTWCWQRCDLIATDGNSSGAWKIKPYDFCTEVAVAALLPVKISFSFLESISTHTAVPAYSTVFGKSTRMPSLKGYVSPFPQLTCKGILHNLTPQ